MPVMPNIHINWLAIFAAVIASMVIGFAWFGPMFGVMCAFFTWLGFYVPQLLAGVAWENKSWKLFSINAAGNFVTLLAQGLILAT